MSAHRSASIAILLLASACWTSGGPIREARSEEPSSAAFVGAPAEVPAPGRHRSSTSLNPRDQASEAVLLDLNYVASDLMQADRPRASDPGQARNGQSSRHSHGAQPSLASASPPSDGDRTPLILTQSPTPPGEAAQPSDPLSGSPPLPDHYLVGTSDQLSIVVRNNPDLSNVVPVRPDGRLSIPLVEDLLVEGKTTKEIAQSIETILSQYLQDPIVTVSVAAAQGAASQRIRVIGAAVAPQALPYRSDLTVLDVVIAVGGLSPIADGNSAIIYRRENGTQRQIQLRLDDLIDDGDTTANVAMAPGDILIIPEGFFSGDWRISQSASLDVTFTDNVDDDPEGEEQEAIITQAGPGLSIRATTARIEAALDSAILLRDERLNDEEGTSFRPNLAGFATVELSPDLFFIDASASISREVLNSRDSDTDANRELVQTYSISPFLVNRYGRFATSETRYALVQTFGGEDGTDDTTTDTSSEISSTTTHEISFTLNSGPDFTRYLWSLGASGSMQSGTDDDEVREANFQYGSEYALSRSWFLLSSIGYQIREETGDTADDDDDDINEPTWNVGVRWRPSPRFELQVTYGRSDGDERADASLSYDISPRTTVFATYSDTLETSQERLQRDLSFIGRDPNTGALIDTRTNTEFDPNTSPFSLRDESTRERRLSVGLGSNQGRNSYSLSVSGAAEGPSDGGTDETNFTATAGWQRLLDRRTTLSVAGSYERSEFDSDDRTDQDYELQTNLGYRIYKSLDGFVAYSYRVRDSNSADNEFTENRVSVGLFARF